MVFMAGLEDGLLPHSRSADDPVETEEERRLCFVGMTRAKRQLILTYARYRQSRGLTRRTVASPFLSELPSEPVRHYQCGNTAEKESSAELKLEGTKETMLQQSGRRGAKRRNSQTDFVAELSEGSTIYHRMFGLGRIEQISKAGKFTQAVIAFEQAGRKTMMLEYDNLHKLSGNQTSHDRT